MKAPAKSTTAPAGPAARRAEPLPPPNEFTLVEHLRVQRQIEARAHRFWLAKGCALKGALNDWLLAETEVLAEFVKSRTQNRPAPPAAEDLPSLAGGISPWRSQIRLPLHLPEQMTA
jgi:hypothetical protein